MVRQFFSVSDTDTAREAVERRVALLEAKKPCEVTARQMCFQELSRWAQGWRTAGDPRLTS